MKQIFLIILYIFSLALSSCGKSINTSSAGSLELKVESKHFIVSCSMADEKCIKDVLNTFESNYDRVTGDLKCKLNEKVKVNIYPDINAFHKAIGNPNAPDWLVGTANGGIIRMVSPLNPGKVHNYSSMIKVVVHEFTHIVQGKISNHLYDMPLWLSEGTAVYEAGQIDNSLRRFVSNGIKNSTVPSLDDMNSNKFSDIGGYQYSYTVVEFIVKNYGYDRLIDLIKSPDDFKDILGISKEEFEKQWKDYLNKNYK